MTRSLGLAILILVLVVAACSSGDGGDGSPVAEAGSPTTEPAPGGEATPTPEPPPERTATPEPTEPPPPPTSDLKIGDPATTANGNTITVYSYEAPATIFDPPPGKVLAAIDVEGCTRPDLEGTVTIGPIDFQLQMPDNTRRDPFSLKEPALHETALAAGDCVRGFMTFEVPEGVTPLFVIFNPRALLGNPVPIKWAVQ